MSSNKHHYCINGPRFMQNKKITQAILSLFAFSLLAIAPTQSYANTENNDVIQNKVDVRLRTSHPNNYVVNKGDTLWAIADKFLQNPWIWPQIWDANPQIKNPHLIYPGDVISVIYVNGQALLHVERPLAKAGNQPQTANQTPSRTATNTTANEKNPALQPRIDDTPTDLPVVRLSPTIRFETIKETVKPIEASAIEAFLIAPKIFSEQEYETLPYVIGDNQSRLISGLGNEIYIRGLDNINEFRYSVYHKGETFIDPENGSVLGYEAILVAEARVRRFGDPAVAFITKSLREVLSGDRLVPTDLSKLNHNILPSVSEVEFDGRIIALFDALSQSARNQIVVTNLGQRDGIEVGNVLAVQKHGGSIVDRFDVNDDGDAKKVIIPNITSGIVMVFKVFERVSYALIMRSDAPIQINDSLSNPK